MDISWEKKKLIKNAVLVYIFATFVYTMRPIKSILNNNLPKKTEKSKNMLYGIVFIWLV